MSAPNCNIGLMNTGYTCSTLLKALTKIVLVPYWNRAGVINTILSSSAPFNLAFFNGLINKADGSERWFPTPTLKNAMNKRAASIMKTYDDGTTALIQQGPRTFKALIDGLPGSATLLGQLESMKTIECGFYGIDIDGNLIGSYLTVDGVLQLNPIRIDVNSADPIYNPGEDKDIQGIELNFTIHRNEVDQNLGLIAAVNIAADIDIRNINGLLDVQPVYADMVAADNDLEVTLNTNFGDLTGFVTVKGLVTDDFVVYRTNNTPGSVTLTSVTEEVDEYGNGLGIYVVVAAVAPTSADIWRITITQPGFNFAPVAAQTVTFT